MSRQLDLQVYLAINGYRLKEIPEERIEWYMREPHYSTDADAMLTLMKKLIDKGFDIALYTIGNQYCVYLDCCHNNARNNHSHIELLVSTTIPTIANTAPMALSKAVYRYYSGLEWEDE